MKRKRALLLFALLFPLLVIVYAFFESNRRPLRPEMPWPSDLVKVNPPTTSLIEFRRHRAVTAGKDFNLQKKYIPLHRIPRHVQTALICSEDGRFYHHSGVDFSAAYYAAKNAVKRAGKGKKIRGGASTLTQQLARNLYLNNEPSLIRKSEEALLAFWLEAALSKKRILELYLNNVEWGDGIFGIESASGKWFDKSAADLSLDEAAALIAVLPSPLKHNPAEKSAWLEKRTREVYRRMSLYSDYVNAGTNSQAELPVDTQADAAEDHTEIIIDENNTESQLPQAPPESLMLPEEKPPVPVIEQF